MLLHDKFTYFLAHAPNPPDWFRNQYIEKTKPKEPLKPEVDENDRETKIHLQLFSDGLVNDFPECLKSFGEETVEYKNKLNVYYANLDWKVQILWSWLYAKTMVDLSTDENMISINSDKIFDDFGKRLEGIIK